MADKKSNFFVTLVFDENTDIGMQVETECEIKTYIRNGLQNAITGKEIKNFVIDDYEVINAKLKEDSYKGKWIPVSEQYKNKQSNCNKTPLPEPYKADNKTEQGLSYADQPTLRSAT